MTEENRRWGRVLAGAVLGCATGISALLLYTNGLFVAGLARDFGLTRTQFGFGVLLVTLALAAANPVVGWAVDRFGARTPAVVGLVLLSVGFAAMGLFVESVNGYLVIQALVAFVGAASGPIAYTKIIGATFDKNRGVALGVTMTGIGISAAAVPPALAWIISDYGWRAGFFSLAIVPIVGALATALLIPRGGSVPAAGAHRTHADSPDAVPAAGAQRTHGGPPNVVPAADAQRTDADSLDAVPAAGAQRSHADSLDAVPAAGAQRSHADSPDAVPAADAQRSHADSPDAVPAADAQRTRVDSSSAATSAGVAHIAGLHAAGSWVRSPVFWMMAAAFAMMAISFAGLLPHFVPMLLDGGLTPVAAGGIAGEIGLAVIASRLFVGFLLDRVFAPRIAIAICVVAAAGFVVLILSGISAASVTAITLGVAMGAELDLMGFLVARYFGLREFGRIYGWLYGAFIFASGLGPLWVGALRDATGNYTLALEISAAGLLLACVGFLLLPRYDAAGGVAKVHLDRGRADFVGRPEP